MPTNKKTPKAVKRPLVPEQTPLKKLRLARGWSSVQLAEMVGTTHVTILRIEKGKQTTPELAAKLVAAFGAAFISEMHILYPERFMKG